MLLRIISYNIHKGFDWRNKYYFLKEMKEFIKSKKADLVFLQEVVGKNKKYKELGFIDSQFEFLADQIWPHYSYGHNAIYDHGNHGNLILSKFPIESYSNINISTNSLEKRGLLICKINIPTINNGLGKTFFAACSHLNIFHTGRMLQYQNIKEQILFHNKDLKLPLIVAGDFNDWNKKCTNIFETHLEMKEVHKTIHGEFAKTFPSFYPLFCLDRIYVSNFNIKNSIILKPTTLNNPLAHLSDHLALYCEVEFHET